MNIRAHLNRIFKIILIALIVLIIMFVLFIAFAIFSFFKDSIIYKNINDYDKCIKSEYYQESISHFPNTIPENIKEANLYCFPSRYEYDGALILLKLKADKKYIENEFHKNKFLNSKTKVGTVQKIYNMPSERVGIEQDQLTYYVLDDKSNYDENGEYFPYFTGIGIDKNYEYILYYYIKPD